MRYDNLVKYSLHNMSTWQWSYWNITVLSIEEVTYRSTCWCNMASDLPPSVRWDNLFWLRLIDPLCFQSEIGKRWPCTVIIIDRECDWSHRPQTDRVGVQQKGRFLDDEGRPEPFAVDTEFRVFCVFAIEQAMQCRPRGRSDGGRHRECGMAEISNTDVSHRPIISVAMTSTTKITNEFCNFWNLSSTQCYILRNRLRTKIQPLWNNLHTLLFMTTIAFGRLTRLCEELSSN